MLSGLSTYPFSIFGKGWERVMPQPSDLPNKGDTVVGNDVWLGYQALVMPGVHIGDGAVVAADVQPYAIVGGNPARELRRRFSESVIQELLRIAWWNWDADKITRNLSLIVTADVDELKKAT
jgi:virginiamycin A acetyltransferase